MKPVLDRLTEAAATLGALLRDQAKQPPTIDQTGQPAPGPGARRPFAARFTPRPGAAGPAPAVVEAMRDLLDKVNRAEFPLPTGPLPGGPLPTGPASRPAPPPIPSGARFLSGTFSCEAGGRPYKLYVPSTHRGRAAPLVVMLHGCTQSPDDFAAGTRMNELAEEHGCLVLYPGQTSGANNQRCWNWFNPADQGRDRGEPAILAGMTRRIMREHAVDPRRVYVAGLSAGGAEAAILAAAYPDLFAAAGVHSGLACGAASDVQTAFAAMRNGTSPPKPASAAGRNDRAVPLIVFHGDRDATVNPRNADAVVSQSAAPGLRAREETGAVPGGHAWRRTLHEGPDGRPVLEQWSVRGGGHAWFGGSPAGSYTDPRGPDASREMLRFFLEHPHPAPAA